jgi:hypothetical protein
MMGVTGFRLIFTPAFYTFIRKLAWKEYKGGLSEIGVHAEDRESVFSCACLSLTALELAPVSASPILSAGKPS